MLRKNLIIESIAYIFILLFLYTGIMKLIDYDSFHFDLTNAPVIKKLEPILAFAVPITELIIALLLFIPKTKKIGLYSSFIIMTLFTIYVGGILSFLKDKPCTCGGILRSLTWGQHLGLNITLTLLALLALFLLRNRDGIANISNQYKHAL